MVSPDKRIANLRFKQDKVVDGRPSTAETTLKRRNTVSLFQFIGWLVGWGLMAQEPFLAKLRQSNGKIQHRGTKILKISENVKRNLFENDPDVKKQKKTS
ncbi:hypothetical protein AVEN_59757-1 [Araneus ventricosus]|uniref:Uncharacterized protein n=1 Tax=Araneus ventricosus TaxID=182803 RepID=A0A4Y2V235_ARAVE|nr:hypothetical protein AVEN_59757-1 [Araneus ventricosus]